MRSINSNNLNLSMMFEKYLNIKRNQYGDYGMPLDGKIINILLGLEIQEMTPNFNSSPNIIAWHYFVIFLFFCYFQFSFFKKILTSSSFSLFFIFKRIFYFFYFYETLNQGCKRGLYKNITSRIFVSHSQNTTRGYHHTLSLRIIGMIIKQGHVMMPLVTSNSLKTVGALSGSLFKTSKNPSLLRRHFAQVSFK